MDQLFSRLSVAIEKSGCLTYKEFLRILRRCYTQSQGETTQEGARPQYARMPCVYAIREWLLPHMCCIHGLYGFHHFAIELNNEGKAELHYKPWCTSQWDDDLYQPLILLKSIPQDIPELVKPDYAAIDIGRLRSMVRKCTEVGVFKEKEVSEWLEFLHEEEKKAEEFDDVDEIVYKDKIQGIVA